MPQITLDMDLEEIKDLVLQLPPTELLALIDAMEERAVGITMMRLGEIGFAEWNEAGEDIYDAAAYGVSVKERKL